MKKNILKVFSTNILSSILGFALMLILSKQLSVNEFGRITYIISLIMILYTLYDFGAVNTVVVFYNKFNKKLNYLALEVLNSFYRKYIYFIVIFSIIIVLIMRQVIELSNLESIIILLNSLLLFIIKYMQSYFHAQGIWTTYNKITLFNNLIKFLTVGVFIYITTSRYLYEYVLYAFGLYIIILFFYVFYISYKYLNNTNNKYDNLKITKIMIPMGIINLLLILIMRGDILLIEHYLDDYQLGLFSVANQLALIFPIIATSMSIVFLKEASENDKKYFKDKIIKKQTYLIIPSILILVFSILFSDYIITFLYGIKYIESSSIFIVLVTIQILGIFFTATESYSFVHYQKQYLFIKLLQLILFIGISILLMHEYQLNGLLFAMILSKVISWILSSILVFRSL